MEHSKLLTVIDAILRELERIAKEPVTKEDLSRAKEHLSGGLLLGLETSDELANYYGGQEILRQKLASPNELLKKIQTVTAAEIQAVAKDIFKNEKLNLALIGPYKEGSEFSKILRFK